MPFQILKVRIVGDNTGKYSKSWNRDYFEKVEETVNIIVDNQIFFYDDKNKILYIKPVNYNYKVNIVIIDLERGNFHTDNLSDVDGYLNNLNSKEWTHLQLKFK